MNLRTSDLRVHKNGTSTITCPVCIWCGKRGTLELTKEQTDRLVQDNNSSVIQRVLSDISKEQREMLISGTHPECWEAFIGPDPEDIVENFGGEAPEWTL